MDHCLFTGTSPVERHHVYGGSRARKKLCEKYGFIAPLTPTLHPNGSLAGRGSKKIDKILKQQCQRYYEDHYGTREDFIREFSKSYL